MLAIKDFEISISIAAVDPDALSERSRNVHVDLC